MKKMTMQITTLDQTGRLKNHSSIATSIEFLSKAHDGSYLDYQSGQVFIDKNILYKNRWRNRRYGLLDRMCNNFL